MCVDTRLRVDTPVTIRICYWSNAMTGKELKKGPSWPPRRPQARHGCRRETDLRQRDPASEPLSMKRLAVLADHLCGHRQPPGRTTWPERWESGQPGIGSRLTAFWGLSCCPWRKPRMSRTQSWQGHRPRLPILSCVAMLLTGCPTARPGLGDRSPDPAPASLTPAVARWPTADLSRVTPQTAACPSQSSLWALADLAVNS